MAESDDRRAKATSEPPDSVVAMVEVQKLVDVLMALRLGLDSLDEATVVDQAEIRGELRAYLDTAIRSAARLRSAIAPESSIAKGPTSTGVRRRHELPDGEDEG